MVTATQTRHFYGGIDPFDAPAYSIREVAHIVRLPVATVRTWVLGRPYPTTRGTKKAKPLIDVADKHGPALSFRNALEVHILGGIRRTHKVEMSAIRSALGFLGQRLGIEHPLVDQKMATDGKDLFIERYGNLLNISRQGQLEMRDVVAIYLSRIEWDRLAVPVSLFPFTRPRYEESPRLVRVDPRVQFGRPCIARTGIPTAIITERYRSGESVEQLADNYEQAVAAIEEAIRFEIGATAA